MDVQIPPTDRLSQSGSSIPKMIGNKTLKRLDLLVRESIQNSLDAAIDRKKSSKVTVEFITGQFNSNSFNRFLGKYFEEKLNKKYGSQSYDYIAVRDSGTVGLTGDPLNDEDRSNLQRLVYNIAQPQTIAGSGGSNGLGKTVFYGIGRGPVIYYSQIVDPSSPKGYSSRLAAVYAEDEKKPNRIMNDTVKNRGIAFFGKYVSDGLIEKYRTKTIPITDEEVISDILGTFKINRYAPGVTGTTIIVAYSDSTALLEETRPKHSDDERDPIWTLRLESYLELAIQRWYAPRLQNHAYDGAWLKAVINGKVIDRDHGAIKPLFELIQTLYNRALPGGDTEDSETNSEFEIFTETVNCNSVSPRTAGYMAWSKVSLEKLKLTTEHYNSVYSMIGDYEATAGMPIITFTRNPGMIVRYTTDDSRWTPKLDDKSEGTVLIAIFRSLSTGIVNDFQNPNGANTLEEYLRACERADHFDWNDYGRLRVVQLISTTFRNRLTAFYEKKIEMDSEQDKTLGNRLAKFLMPSGGFRYDNDRTAKTGSKRITNSRCKKSPSRTKFTDFISTRDKNGIEVSFEAQLTENKTCIFVTVITESDTLSCSDWEKEIRTPFPLSVEVAGNGLHLVNDGKISDERIKYNYLRSNTNHNIAYGFIIEATTTPVTITGSFTIHSKIPSLKANVVCEGGRLS